MHQNVLSNYVAEELDGNSITMDSQHISYEAGSVERKIIGFNPFNDIRMALYTGGIITKAIIIISRMY